jgi:hypothetical protein
MERNGGDKSMQVKVGDFVFIKESIIDRKVQEYLLKNQNKTALRWEGYRNFSFKIIGIDEQHLVILLDANGNEIHISGRHLET